MIRRPPRSTQSRSSAASDVYKRQAAPLTPSTYYFAEGTCRPNFDTYFCIQNPGSAAASVTLNYMKGDGTSAAVDVTVPKNSRVMVSPRDTLGTGDDEAHDFSTRVTSNQPIIVERPMYFNYNGVWTGGSDAVGATALASTYYFAEGKCRPDFDTYCCIQNPGSAAASVTLNYTKGDGTSAAVDVTVPKNSRVTVSPRDTLGTGDDEAHDFSTRVTSNQPIIVERPMYFNYNGVWTGGSDAVGLAGNQVPMLTSTSPTSAYLGPEAGAPIPLTSIGAITGTAQVGQTLTAGALSPSGATATYQWKYSTTPGGTYTNIPGATSNTYTIATAYLGDYIKVAATGTGGYTGTVTSAYVGPVTTPLTSIGAITGTAQVGQTLTAGALSPSGATATYQWKYSTTPGGTYNNIAGATSNTYTIATAYLGDYIKVSATGTGNYTGTVTSAYVGPVTTPLTSIGAITGTAQVGQKLTAGALSPSGATASYQWEYSTTPGGTYNNIAGATSSTYTIATAYVNDYIKVSATGTGNYTGTVTSAPTTAIATNQLTISDPTLTISDPTLTRTKPYDRTTTAAVTAGTLSGVIAGDDVTVSAAANYDTADVGTGKTITVVYTLGGAAAGNYTAPANYVVNDGVITAIQLTISDPTLTRTKPYDRTTTAAVTAGTLSGVIAGDDVTVSAAANYDTACLLYTSPSPRD